MSIGRDEGRSDCRVGSIVDRRAPGPMSQKIGNRAEARIVRPQRLSRSTLHGVDRRPLAPPQPPLSDGTVELRLWRGADISAIVAACQDPEIPRWTPVPEPFTEEDAREWLATHEPKMAAGEGLPLAIVAPTGEVLGSIELHIRRQGVGQIGYWVGPWARRRRVATRALVLMSRWALATLPLFRLQVTAAPDNFASQAVAERAGFRREGLLRSYAEIKGRSSDLVMFSRLPSDAD